MKKIVIMSTVSYSIDTLIKCQPKYLLKYFDVVELLGADTGEVKSIYEREGIKFTPIDMQRKITPLQDLKTLYRLVKLFKEMKPDIIYTFTPKAGLLGMMAGFFAGCKTRVHHVVGMPLMEAKGIKKFILTCTEKLTYLFATHIYSNSFGLKDYINQTLTKKEIKVIHHGSINGVDIDFYRDIFSEDEKKELKSKLGFKEEDFILSFMGRIVKDKGVNELIEAFKMLNAEYDNIKLLIVGKFEQELNPISEENKSCILENKSIKFVGFKDDLREYLTISNLFILPSYREGLPNSLIEAGSFGIPLIASNINGCNEIIIDNKNGKLVMPKDVNSLYSVIQELYLNQDLYKKIKNNVRESIINRYSKEDFLEILVDNLLSDLSVNKDT